MKSKGYGSESESSIGMFCKQAEASHRRLTTIRLISSKLAEYPRRVHAHPSNKAQGLPSKASVCYSDYISNADFSTVLVTSPEVTIKRIALTPGHAQTHVFKFSGFVEQEQG